ncbi:DUF4437 domain-containing protein [Rhodopirellula bahusiensis]|uniref:DUF4437 domain-containing protein n=1 Tax=Rhodopirellula bahusiensis TaxID=2014065 RepID=UPI00326488B0
MSIFRHSKNVAACLSFTFVSLAPLFAWSIEPIVSSKVTTPSNTTTEVVLASEVQWQSLNPLRGDKAPQAGTLWGDQNKDESSGFLVKFRDGFSSPPHIHNITYRGVVIGGGLFNDDPSAEPMWMPAGSYWMQPAGEVHITAARGASIAFLEIQSGPYLVMPPKEAFDEGERPLNLDASNMVWLDSSTTNWIDASAQTISGGGPKLSFLWGNPDAGQVNGTLVKLPAGFVGKLTNDSETFRAVVIQGQAKLYDETASDITTLTTGSYFGSKGSVEHTISTDEEALLYVRTEGDFGIVSK